MSKPLRALLLAAGLGTRLRPFTLHTPKCLVPIRGEPLLALWLRKLEAAGCEAVLVNIHHLADQVMHFLQSWSSSTMTVETVYEPELLGTAGTLMANQTFFKGSTGLLIHADNAMTEGLRAFLRAHNQRQNECLITMLTFTTATPSICGIVETNNKGVVTSFHEKVANPPGNCANGALYSFDPQFIDFMGQMGNKLNDFSTEVIPKLMGRIQTWHTDQHYLDIGTPDSLKQAQHKYGAKF